MGTASRRPAVRSASHSAVSLTAGFASGLVLFLAAGAAPGDAVFSALALAALVTAGRLLRA